MSIKEKIALALILLFSGWSALHAQALKNAIPQDTSFTPLQAYEKEKKRFPQIKLVKPALPEGVSQQLGVVYSTLENTPYGKRDLHLNLFYPSAADKLRPGVLLVHGGGWRSGNYTMPVPIARHLAANGYVAATVEYRLSLEAPYPAALHDVKAAIRWLRANAKTFSLDTTRLAIMGFSAGGQLAALTAVTGSQEKFEGQGGNAAHSSSVQALIDVDGVIAFVHPQSSEGAVAAGWLGGTSKEKPEIWKEASALTHAGEDSPPTLFIGSQYPRFLAGHKEMMDILERHGIYTEAHYFPDTPHPFWLFHPWFEPTVEYSVNFLQKVFD